MKNSLQTYLGAWAGVIPSKDNSSSIEQRAYRLYYLGLESFDYDDIRFMIGQRLGLKLLVPIAIDLLEKEPLLEANYYEGDLLSAVLKLPENFWNYQPMLKDRVSTLLESNMILIEQSLDLRMEADRELKKLVEEFKEKLSFKEGFIRKLLFSSSYFYS
ncbi:contact-dependent growth inhibition system immunity protein [Limibacter armeniacum]|uniref:contact-dependent growth inhibition system immunity protein n=1 Tax=Limibacter armeniacum TaxID=466084 RepID=UPI002FE66017